MNSKRSQVMHVFEVKEVILHASRQFANPYTEVVCWLELEGPNVQKKIYGFWNGGDEFVFRVTATQPGEWQWKSCSNPPDAGLDNHSGSFTATHWEDSQLSENLNRRGYVRVTANGRALEYDDGTPFLMLGDTWWAASTWRFPFKGIQPDENYIPGENISFEEALNFRKNQGYNTIAMIAAFPNWHADHLPAQWMNHDSIGVRQAWEKNGVDTAKDMHDENGNMPFESWNKAEGIADFDRLNPAYFQSLDKKIQYMNDKGFVCFLETVRRDHGPSWKKYFDWPESYARYVQYIIARYGAYNILFSGIHLDWINADYSLTAAEFNEALTYHHQRYGKLPYGQPHTILIDGSTYQQFGHREKAPWLTMHAVGNVPRNHGFYPMLEEIFALEPPYPAANLEPYYPGWDNVFHNTVAGERPTPNSERDNYFARTQMYGSVLSGGLAGHLYGTGAYDGTTTGEVRQAHERPYIWDALNYPSGGQLQYLGKFLLSAGSAYQKCEPQKELLIPHKAKNAPEDGLDGWAFLLIAPSKDLGFLYFENQAQVPQITGLIPDQVYTLAWFDPIVGEWLPTLKQPADELGTLRVRSFPDDTMIASRDWCLKVTCEMKAR